MLGILTVVSMRRKEALCPLELAPQISSIVFICDYCWTELWITKTLNFMPKNMDILAAKLCNEPDLTIIWYGASLVIYCCNIDYMCIITCAASNGEVRAGICFTQG